MSWWPKAYSWEAGHYDIGYWTSNAELWFQQRLDKMRSHDAKPMPLGWWRDQLKSANNAKKLKQAVNKASRQFMEANGESIFVSP